MWSSATTANDFASTIGIGAVVSTKFTWPRDPKPQNEFLLTPRKEAEWRRWIALYNEKRLPEGRYRGELYDIGFDKPEAHVIAKDGRYYYAFYADHWDGPVELRGLGKGRYTVADTWTGRTIGSASATANRLIRRRSSGSSCSRRRRSMGRDDVGRRPSSRPAEGVAALCVRNHDPVGRVGRIHGPARRSAAFPKRWSTASGR